MRLKSRCCGNNFINFIKKGPHTSEFVKLAIEKIIYSYEFINPKHSGRLGSTRLENFSMFPKGVGSYKSYDFSKKTKCFCTISAKLTPFC